ncbi:hypothetical protein PYCCODRAFT_1434048 [Trametes coccinea BRFM310]|uniref:Uncharacterized protein n=1 Tax=Trametes coccinea (strain BRFM310) TaxID=1353009 RepID=A0A1Y2IRC8_TRAC3|nr:hypothetical protein PYCCODRAFT_1434048 [Trametes coccinea BRFM310]
MHAPAYLSADSAVPTSKYQPAHCRFSSTAFPRPAFKGIYGEWRHNLLRYCPPHDAVLCCLSMGGFMESVRMQEGYALLPTITAPVEERSAKTPCILEEY